MSDTISSVLFVCLGNICRSPTAEAVFRHKARLQGLQLKIDSAGTHGYHTDSPPDERSRAAGESRGYDFAGIKCRKVSLQDFEDYDLLIAMDNENIRNLKKECPDEYKHKIQSFMSYSDLGEAVVPDPYYGGKKGFEYVLDLIENASDGLIRQISVKSR